jgi:hypothetical protein
MHGDFVALAAVIFIFGGGIIKYAIGEITKMVEMKTGESNRYNTETLQAVEALRRDVAALRETTTNFDMSFDAALTRLEGRVDRMDGNIERPAVAAATSLPPVVPAPEVQVQTITLGSGRGV